MTNRIRFTITLELVLDLPDDDRLLAIPDVELEARSGRRLECPTYSSLQRNPESGD